MKILPSVSITGVSSVVRYVLGSTAEKMSPPCTGSGLLGFAAGGPSALGDSAHMLLPYASQKHCLIFG